VRPTTLTYLQWSESPIILDRMDHLDCFPKLERFPIIVDPLVGMTQLTRALMDRGSGLNLIQFAIFGHSDKFL
jgi:hypothetical protein